LALMAVLTLDPSDAVDLAEALALAEAEQQAPSYLAPLDWARENATIVLPGRGRVPFEPYPYQASFLEDASPKRLVLKARQVGMSNAIAIEALYRALTMSDRQVLMVSRNGLLAQQLVTYCRHALGGLKHQPDVVQENLSTLVFGNGSRILSLPASPSAGRGFPASDLYLDEFAFALYAQMIYESTVPALAPDGTLTVLSTPNGRANLYFRLWSGLEGGDWSRHTIHWTDCPRYDAAWAERQRRTMTRQAFAQEYDCDFIASGDAVFNADDLVRCHAGWEPAAAGWDRLVTAWDIGRRRDHTVGITIGRRAEERIVTDDDGNMTLVSMDVWHELEYERMLDPYPVVQGRIDARNARLGGTCRVESNGVGDPVIENLETKVEPFVTTPKTKVQAIQALQLLIQQGRFKYGSEQLDRELALYQWDDKALVQDSVMAAAIAAYEAELPGPQGGFW
jgi:hypothetical protein